MKGNQCKDKPGASKEQARLKQYTNKAQERCKQRARMMLFEVQAT